MTRRYTPTTGKLREPSPREREASSKLVRGILAWFCRNDPEGAALIAEETERNRRARLDVDHDADGGP